VQLLNETGKPFDFVVTSDPRTYADLVEPAGLAEVATYASGIGVPKGLLIPLTPDGALGTPTTLVDDAHANGLIVHSFTFRAENYFLPTDFQSSTDAAAVGDLSGEVQRFLELGIDGFFTDHADISVRARDAFMSGL
jgi:glycerophosphoryl diester phosphodiesterase